MCQNRVAGARSVGHYETMARLKATQRREQLIESATGLFARFGYDGTTTAAIAAEAGITEPVLYRHFASKQDLFVAVVQALSDTMTARWQAICDLPLSPEGRVRQACQYESEALRAAPEAFRLFHGAMANSRNEVVLGVIREHFRQLKQLLASLLHAGQEQGVFREDFEPDAMVSLLIAMGIGYAMQDFAVEPGVIPADAFADFVLRQVTVAACGGPTSAGGVSTSEQGTAPRLEA